MADQITELTRRNIIDELRVSNICWHGRLGEGEFLNRTFDLTKLPSHEGRFSDMYGDVQQHRVNNYDWEDDWIYEDSRLNLIGCDDEVFLHFLCEMINPTVRGDSNEIQDLLKIFNSHLKADNFKLDVKKLISEKPIFHAISLNGIAVSFENFEKIGRSFTKEQLEKCEKKLAQNDFDGAITNARSLLEDVIARDIHKQITGKEMETKGDLAQDFKRIKPLLNFVEEADQLDNSFKQVTSGLTSIVHGLSSIGNKMGDRHSREIKPEKHHAKLVVNSTKAIVDFLYDVLDYQKLRVEKIRTEMLELPYIRYGEGACHYGKCYSLKNRDELLHKEEYQKFAEKYGTFIKRRLLDELLTNFQISCFDDADRFFVLITLFFDVVNESDIEQCFQKTKNNKQAGLIRAFLEDLYEVKSGFLSKKMHEFRKKLS